MERNRLNYGEETAGISAILLFAFMFLDWFGVEFSEAGISVPGKNAWEALDYTPIVLVVAIFAALGVVALRLTRAKWVPAARANAVVAILGVISSLLILLRTIAPPPPSTPSEKTWDPPRSKERSKSRSFLRWRPPPGSPSVAVWQCGRSCASIAGPSESRRLERCPRRTRFSSEAANTGSSETGPSEQRVAKHVSLGRGNIDHILIGRAGIFTIETKSHRGPVRVDRIDPRMLKQAYAQRMLLERITGYRVEPLLVFSDAWLIGHPLASREGVSVIPARMLERYLSSQRPAVTSDRARLVHEQLAAAIESAL
jgi:hypothetical protein